MHTEMSLTADNGGMLCALTKRIMIISPLPDRVRSLLVTLSAECFDVFSLHDFDKSMLPGLQPELLIYDALPIGMASDQYSISDGVEIIQDAENYGVPVLVLLDQQSFENQAKRAQTVSDAELLVWPTQPDKALERINRILESRPNPGAGLNRDEIYTFKDIQVDRRKMTVEQGGARIELTKTEYDLLLHFITSDGSVLTRELLLDKVWGIQFYGSSNVVDVHIKSLRKKLGDSAVTPKYIITVRGAGYRLADERSH